MTTATLVSLCSTKDADPDVRLRQYMRCTDYLSGAIDVLRWVYFEKKVICLPQGFTLGDLQGEVIAAEKHVPNPNDLGAAQFISFVMNLNHGCPLVPVLSFSD